MPTASYAFAALEARVEGIADGIADLVEGEDGESDRQAGKDRGPEDYRVAQAGLGDVGAPGGSAPGETEERQRGLGEDGVAEQEGREDDREGRDVRGDVAEENAAFAGAY